MNSFDTVVEMPMKTMTMIYFKPKPEYFDAYVAAIKITWPADYILTRDEEVIHVLVSDSIEELTDSQPKGLEWLDQHRYMLQEYSPEEGHTRPYTAFIAQEASVS